MTKQPSTQASLARAFADVVGSALTCWTARLTTCRHSSPR